MSILNRNKLRRVSQPTAVRPTIGQTVTTGDGSIDQRLPGGGWPLASLTELYADRRGESDIALLVPTIQRVLRYSHRRIALISAPRLSTAATPSRLGMDASRFWQSTPRSSRDAFDIACEAMQSGAFGVVMYWQDGLAEHQIRHLNRTADEGHCLAFLCRQAPAPRNDLPCPRLQVSIRQDQASGSLYILASGEPVSRSLSHPVRSGARAA